jgi:mannose-1-phosphate guanylyltransferase
LQETLRRAQSIASPERICTIVAAQHSRWWSSRLSAIFEQNWIVQPQNRGTANGILLGLLHILERNLHATLVLPPSDHDCQDEPTLRQSLRQAVARLSLHSQEILLLGIEADAPDPERGYIVPVNVYGDGVSPISEFVEKPTLPRAEALIERGALWNAFIFAAKGRVLLALFERRFPKIVRDMRRAVRSVMKSPQNATPIEELYGGLPSLDFSRHILQESRHEGLCVLAVPACGWSDLGTPERIAETLRRIPLRGGPTATFTDEVAHISFSERHRTASTADSRI